MTEFKKEVYWSKFADTFDEDQVYIVGSDIRQAVIKRLSEESNLGEVIEFGCGRGFFTKIIAKNAIRVLATDLSDEMVEAAKMELKGFQNIIVQKADCENTAFPTENFDTLVMVNVVHFLENPDKCLQESYRILKAGGVLLLVDYTAYGMKLLEMMKFGMRLFKRWGKPLKHFKKNISPNELSSLAEDAGFKVEEVQLIGDKTKAIYLRGIKK